jgi:tetratricopeptide (TPR) repeat protein
MRIFACLIVSLLVTLAPSPAAGDDYLDSSQVAILAQVQELLFDDQFAAADSLLNTYNRVHPNEPAGILFQASSLLAQMVDREEGCYEASFDSLIDRAKTIARSHLAEGSARRQAWMHLFCGHAMAYRSVYNSHFGSFTSAIRDGFSAKGEYQQALKIDSTLLDVYAGLGSFHYWKSAKAGLLKWLGIFKNDADKGIAELNRAADASTISREASRNALIWVYFDCGKNDSAEAIVRRAMTRYPHGKSFLWPLAQSLFERKQYDKAIEVYSEIRDRLSPEPGNYYNIVECDYYLASCHDKLEEESKAVEAAKNLGEYYDAIPKQTRQRQQSKLGFLRRLASNDD